ncbi:D-alanyl-D-alanine carboxypeptidase/D-alanyl-D-alanine-endopeptidase [Rhodococcus sp. NPDC003318]|uniref:D-alanyl-D-alanine carboxypeptidase/D-alanyl-D-alanine endopeptidase n=1 Tax=Rhodococcus sp. NPDC003318 TaxID=3364503 RepID=UPI0036BF0997
MLGKAGAKDRKLGSLAARRRKRVRLLLGVVAVGVIGVVVAALVLLVPNLGFGTSTASPTTTPAPPPVTPTQQVAPVPADAPTPTPAGVAAALGPALANPALGSFTGVVSDAASGAVLWSQGADTPMVPASTTKVLTAAAALLALPPEHRVATRVVQGSEPGQIVVVGGGDPTLTAQPAGQPGYYPGAPHLDDLVAQVRSAGATVESVVVDAGAYTGTAMARGWMPTDIAAGYIAPIEPMMLDGARRQALEDESPRSATPALDVGTALAAAFGLPPDRVTVGTAPSGAAPLASVESAPLRDRLGQMMSHSDNVLAETVGREIAAEVGTEPSFAGATEAILRTLDQGGFDTTGTSLYDASGLSVDGRIPARLLDEILTAATGDGHPELRPMLDYLPVAGATGTLSDRYGTGVGAGWVRAKTGTLSEASALVGYVTDVDNRVLTFALMSNDRSPDVSRPALDAIASTLRTCGCT